MKIKFKEKVLKRFLALVMALVLVVNSGIFVYAEEAAPTPVPTPQVESSEPTPAPGQDITTGDASSDASSDTTANVNVDQISGEITTPPGDCTSPEGQIECPVENNNSADISGGIDSTSTTGQNTSTGSAGDAAIVTGDATAGGEMSNNINNNVVEATSSAELTGSDLVSTGVQDTIGLETGSDPVNNVENNNQVAVQNNAEVSATSGQNSATENEGNADITTGDALAYANLFNLLNTNIVGSNFELLVLNLIEQNGNIDLNALWKAILLSSAQDQLILASQTDLQSLTLLIQNNNQASLENNLAVTASSGQNLASENGGDVNLQTGDATALANVVNVINTNLVGSKFLLAFINILVSFNGDLILPRPENFKTDIPGLEGELTLQSQNQNGGQTSENQAEISGNVDASADSGGNQLNENMQGSNLETGEAKSASTNLIFANFDIQRNNWFFLVVNNLGSWLGALLGWASPQSSETLTEGASSYSLGLEADPTSQVASGDGGIVVENQNQATINNEISASAVSGQNLANDNGGQADVRTGKAKALANLLNLVNLNIFGGRWFLGIINVVGDWNGNAVFAYPDVTISISGPGHEVVPGEEAFYNISFENKGYDEAKNVQVRLNLPKGADYTSDSSGISPQVSGQSLLWNLGSIDGKAAGSFQVKVRISQDLKPSDLLSFWQKLISAAYAAEDGQKGNLVVKADVSTIDPQSDTNNDSSQTTTTVYFPSSNNYDAPALEITATNNVGEFVYPSDTVTFELILKNKGAGIAKNVVISQSMYDGTIDSLGDAEFTIGDLPAGKSVKVNFGLALTEDLPADIYTTIATAYGVDEKGDRIESNEGRTQFEVRDINPKGMSLVSAKTDESGGGQILGGQEAQGIIGDKKDYLLYLLFALLGTLGLITLFKRKIFAQRR